MSSTSLPCRRTWRRPRLAAAIMLLALLVAGGAACTDDDSASRPGTPTDDSIIAGDDPLDFMAYVDPSVPIVAAIGERFALMLDAEPTEGFRWEVVVQADPAVVLPLGSQFVARESITVPTTTTSVPPPPVEDTPNGDGEPTPTGPPDTTGPEAPATDPTPAPTPTTAPSRALQVFSYVGRGFGTTVVELRYVRVGQPVTEATPLVTFTIEIPLPPELLPPPDPDPEAGADTAP